MRDEERRGEGVRMGERERERERRGGEGGLRGRMWLPQADTAISFAASGREFNSILTMYMSVSVSLSMLNLVPTLSPSQSPSYPPFISLPLLVELLAS